LLKFHVHYRGLVKGVNKLTNYRKNINAIKELTNLTECDKKKAGTAR